MPPIGDLFTTAEAQRIRDNHRVLTNRPPGVDIVEKMQTVADAVDANETDVATNAAAIAADVAELAKVVTGTATILNGTTSIAVTLGASFDGKYAVVSMAEAPTAASLVWAAPVAGGDLTINCDVDNTADLDVHYVVDGR